MEVARAEIDERIELLPAGELGEIVIRGHNVFAGYLGRPEATAQAMVDGWFRTGDLGVKDDQGFVTIVDRKKDMVIRGGFNVYPREVEEVLARHPAVGQVAVIGVPDPVHGEEVCAVVVPAAREGGRRSTAEALVDWSPGAAGTAQVPPPGPVRRRSFRWGRATRCSSANCVAPSRRSSARPRLAPALTGAALTPSRQPTIVGCRLASLPPPRGRRCRPWRTATVQPAPRSAGRYPFG